MYKTLSLTAAVLLVLGMSTSYAYADNDNKGNNGRDDTPGQTKHAEDDDDRDDKSAKGGYGGGQIEKVEVCRATGSKWLPYVKVTVPVATATKWISEGKAVEPDEDGDCPKPKKTIREYVRERLSSIFDRLPFFARS